ncbi:MAG: ATP-binding protein, partial [Dehalococcoidia bacterium]|nr:ATP-binding protein [Dehalococcoidia bacterium]
GAGRNLIRDPVVAGIATCYRDVTERKAVEAKLALSQRLATLGEVAGNISHELRNPLAVIGASVFYLKSRLKDSPDEKLQAHLARIATSVDRSSVIMQTLLDMARAKEPNYEKLDLNTVVSQAIDICNLPPTIELVREFPVHEAWVSADRGQLLLAFRNLVTNAVEAMQKAGTLTVNIRSVPNAFEVTFADTGTGIATDDLKRIFEPLFSTKSHGVGLGLSLSKSIVVKHGGTIDVISKQGRGAVFTVRLPARQKPVRRMLTRVKRREKARRQCCEDGGYDG